MDSRENIVKTNIRNFMDKNKLTQSALAEIVGMSQPRISSTLSLNSKSMFSLEQLLKIADYFGVTLDELAGYSQMKNKSSHTMSDIISMLFEMDDSINLDIVSRTKHDIAASPASGEPIDITVTNYGIEFSSAYLNNFLEEWKSARQIASNDGEIYKSMYNAWKNDVLKKAESVPCNENIFSTDIDLSEELPFD